MIKGLKVFSLLGWLLMAFPLIGISNEAHFKENHPKTIFDEVLENPSLSTFSKVIVNTDFVDILESQGPFTLFAPSNEAFAKLPIGTLDNWLKPSNKEKLMAILKYHVVLGRKTMDDLKKDKGMMTLQGEHVRISAKNDKITINNANVIKQNLEFPNGVVHIIDQVLIPK